MAVRGDITLLHALIKDEGINRLTESTKPNETFEFEIEPAYFFRWTCDLSFDRLSCERSEPIASAEDLIDQMLISVIVFNPLLVLFIFLTSKIATCYDATSANDRC